MILTSHRVLAVGAHTDDVELGCGGTLSRLRQAGAELHVHALSRAEASLPVGASADTLEREFHASMALLQPASATVHRLPVRNFPQHRQDILETLVAVKRSLQPDLVLTHASTDTHQDHRVVHEECVRAFRGITILGFEIPWNQSHSTTNAHVQLREEDMELKERMLAQYASQQQLGRGYTGASYIHSAAVFRGHQARLDLAEAFEVISLVWKASSHGQG